MNKLDFGRNFSVDKFENDDWNEMMQHGVFQNFDKKELFLLCMAIGFKSNQKKKLDDPNPVINAVSLNEKQKFLLLSEI